MENNNLIEDEGDMILSRNSEEYTPKLFSEDQNYQTDGVASEEDYKDNYENDQLFDQDVNEEEDFEIPAFLRKQKF